MRSSRGSMGSRSIVSLGMRPQRPPAREEGASDGKSTAQPPELGGGAARLGLRRP
jgi:hypothetical protein